jgi:hypothetical protein
MPERTARQRIIVSRKGKMLHVLPDQSFDFTQSEIDDIMRLNKEALAPEGTMALEKVEVPSAPKAVVKKTEEDDPL